MPEVKFPPCAEMKKLRNELDRLGITWVDTSSTRVCQTRFMRGKKRYSVINGLDITADFPVENYEKVGGGLLEMWDFTQKNDPIRFLKAEEVIARIA